MRPDVAAYLWDALLAARAVRRFKAATKRVPNLIQVLEGLLREADVVFRQ